MPVLLKPLKLTKPWIGKPEYEAVFKVLESGWLTEGTVTQQFEDKVAEYVGAKYAVAVCNCTVALELCLRALEITGEVVIPSFTHPATARAVINAGATPILADVDSDDYTLRVDKCPNTAKTVIPVSWGGNPTWSVPYDAAIIEDAACSLGSEVDGEKTGKQYTACFSFHPRKLITTGEGGMITTNDQALANTLREMKHFGVGNFKLSDVNSALGLAQMGRLQEIIRRRNHCAFIYDELLENVKDVRVPKVEAGVTHTYQTYAVYLEKANRNTVIQKLATKNIETQIGTYALHLLSRFKHLTRVGKLWSSEQLHHNLLALPMAYDLTGEDQKRAVDELQKAIA